MTVAPASSRPGRQRVGFLAHQAVEYVLGAALVVSGVHVTGSVQLLLIGLGVVLILLSAFTRGPLGAARLLGRRLHHVLDLVVIAALALSPLASLHHPNFAAITIAEAVAVLLLRIERGTSYGPTPARGGAVTVAGGAPTRQNAPLADASSNSLAGTFGQASFGPSPGPGSLDSSLGPASFDPSSLGTSSLGPTVLPPSTAGGSPGAPARTGAATTRPAATELAAVARSGAAVASAAAAQLAPVAAKAARRGAFQLGVLTATARRAARQRAASAPQSSKPAAAPPGGPGQG